jgi:methyltransferase (TIGR00027 family)
LFEDPLAVKIVGTESAARLARAAPQLSTTKGANSRAFVVVRSRFAEDRLREAIKRGVRQYVLLGAGFDTFGYRNADPDLSVFELDHPATQALKREVVTRAGIPVPETLTYESVDFERETVPSALEQAGFDFEEPAQVSWLGVAIYLEPEAVLSLLGSLVRSLSKGSEIVFDFAAPLRDLEPTRRAMFEAMSRESEMRGEPYRSSFDRTTLAARLEGLGCSVVEMLGPEELNQRYLEHRTDGVALGGPGEIARIAL